MTAISTNTAGRPGAFSRLLSELRARRARNALQRRTERELHALSDRDLADLGIARCDIRRIAWQAAND